MGIEIGKLCNMGSRMSKSGASDIVVVNLRKLYAV